MIIYCIMESDLLKHLNPVQQQAVTATDGPTLILAGAGSGKTRVLTYKVAYLILEKYIKPENILMVTFTNKAAGEMKERITKLLSDKDTSDGGEATTSTPPRWRNQNSTLPFAGTFHSLCARILRRSGKTAGISPDFLIYDEEDSKDLIKDILLKLNLDKKRFNPAAVLATISGSKNELIGALEYPQYARGYFQEEVARIYIEYQKKLAESNALDFDDLIFATVKLFQKSKDAVSFYQDKFHYVLVDEFQDTNHAQYELTKLLSGRWKNLCVVGDASQSIYAWRGADFRNILNFRRDFLESKIFHLEQNYRSTPIILDAAFAVVSKNHSHPILKLWTEKQSGPLITAYQAQNEQDEAMFIIKEITDARYKSLNIRLSDFAVLYRTNAQSRNLEEALLHAGIPYILVGGVRFYERKEIKDVISYLRLLHNPKDSVSYKRIEKLGKKRLERFLEFAQKYRLQTKDKQSTTLEILDQTLKASSYLSMYDPDNEEDFYRLENIKELRSVASEFPDLSQFLENVALVEQEYLPIGQASFNSKDKKGKDSVILMTLHAAKGLEFKTVFMVGMEEGLFPHARSLMEPLELEEERRLCYVGITRAMEKLYFTYAARRLYFGQRTANQVSRFIYDVPKHLIAAAIDHSI
ncbi:UvrD-helicase domain-containing protein [Candidatus Gottesmanbacteria bacterium]|nr:UvrD-helicase domain-containing protein [Candidatus Gottesmanbacteria bacterium]